MYRRARVDHVKPSPLQPLTLSVEVLTTGGMAADEVVQVYVSHPGIESATAGLAKLRTHSS